MYKYFDIIGAEAIIENNTLKFSSPDCFNDPFEFHDGLVKFDVDKNYIKGIVRKRTNDKKLIKKFLSDFESDKAGFIENLINQFRRQKSETKICCFSETNLNILMWSHYSKNHTGACIQFDEAMLGKTFTGNSLISSVRYTQKLKALSFSKYRDKAVTNWVLTKSKDWEYEKEKRIVLGGNPDTIQRVSPQAILKIIFGCKTIEKDLVRISDLIEQKGFKWIRVSKMKIDCKEYRLIENYLK
jgi:hypothetical protein